MKSARKYTGIKSELELFKNELSDKKNHESEKREGADKDGPFSSHTRCAAKTKDYKKEITEEPKTEEKSPTAGRADKSDNTRSEYD